MTVGKIAGMLAARLLVSDEEGAKPAGCFVCDIMSRTMAQGFSGMAWITHRADMNALAVAVMRGAACLIFPAGIEPEEEVIRRAGMERMPLMTTGLSAFETAGRLYEAGLRGEEN